VVAVVERKHQQPSGWNFGVGRASLAGTDPDRPQKVNQDGCFVLPQGTGSSSSSSSCSKQQRGQTEAHDHHTVVQVICAMDGHGLQGHVVVQYLHRQLARIVSHRLGLYDTTTNTNDNDNDDGDDDDATESSETLVDSQDRIDRQVQELETWGRWNRTEEQQQQHDGGNAESNRMVVVEALIDSFLVAQRSAQDNPSIPSGRSGTTCILATVLAATHDTSSSSSSLDVVTATVGDSHAIAIAVPHEALDDSCDRAAATAVPHAAWTVQALSMPTTVKHMASERARIQACEGRIDDNGNVWYGPMGIAMTRSLGNSAMLRAGILPVPIVTQHSLPLVTNGDHSSDQNPLSYLVCVGTDGVFDVLSHERMAHILQRAMVHESLSLDEAAAEVCRQARLAWLADLPMETRVDDATFVKDMIGY
jgi:Protein phosphatase 2C